MPRNAEVIRQWRLLLHLDRRAHGSSVDDLARELNVTKRTIWRDVAALQEAGFPLVDEKRDRKTTWRVLSLPLKSLTDAGMSVTEICSLYMGRELLLTLTGTPFEAGVNSLIKKVQKALSPRTRAFLDELPNVVRVRPEPRKKVSAGYNELVAKLIEASTRRKAVEMRYFSVSSNRLKDYLVHPYNVQYSDPAGTNARSDWMCMGPVSQPTVTDPVAPQIFPCGFRASTRAELTPVSTNLRQALTYAASCAP